MNITIDQLLNGKPTKIKDKVFLSTKAYVEPFLEEMSKFTNDFLVSVKQPDQLTTSNNELDITYNRVLIQAVLPKQYSEDNHDGVIGLVYGLDTRKPIVKLYKGALNCACTNLCIFNPAALHVQELLPQQMINYNGLTPLIEQFDDISMWIKNLKNMYWDRTKEAIAENLGNWIINSIKMDYNNGLGKINMTNSMPIKAYKLLFEDDSSPYYIFENEQVSMFKVYNAFTELIRDDKDLINLPEKTLLTKQILGL